MSVLAMLPATGGFVEAGRGLLRTLQQHHQREKAALLLLDAHYQGTQPLSYMAPELVAKLGSRLRQVVIHWPELVVDSVEERLDVEGFRIGDAAEADERLWDMWQANGLDVGSHQAHVDALTMKRSYVVVGARGLSDVDPSSGVDTDIPLITWQSPLETYALRDPRTRRITSAASWWDDEPVDGGPRVPRAVLYLPGSTSWWSLRGTVWVLDLDGSVGIDDHGLGVCPVVPLVNRPRTSRQSSLGFEGWSDLEAVIPLSDAACKAATDMMVGSEFHALPRRWVTGIQPEDVTDPNGQPVSPLSQVAGYTWMFPDDEGTVKLGQFAEASLSNYHETVKMLAQLVASVSGLPPHYLGSATDNPASADAIRSSEARLVKRAERKQRAFGEAWEQVMRLALLVADGTVPVGVRGMETVWRDASTPTVAQKADAAVKLYTAGIVPRRQTWTDLGYSAAVQDRMEDDLEKDAARQAAAFGVGPAPVVPGQVTAVQADPPGGDGPGDGSGSESD